jgi:uncharacterized coiled-coil protein SlyX
MIFKSKMPYETAVLEIVQILLDPLSERFPDVVISVYQSLSGGHTPDRAGPTLLKGLIAWRDAVVTAEVKAALQKQEQYLTEIRSREVEQSKTILELQKKISHLEQRIGEQESEIEPYQKTIQQQNSIISEQHERLIALLGHARS